MAILKWIDDKKLIDAVTQLLGKAEEAKINSTKEFGKNVIDPFSAVFEIAGFELDYNAWIENETTRQAQKTLQNHIGSFHQNILGHCKGWKNLETGVEVDLICEKKKIIAEIKNKYNTVTGGNLAGLYSTLNELISRKASKYKDYTAYYVVVIPKKPLRFNNLFTPSDKGKGKKCEANENIREIDGASFYSLVTGYENALEELFDALPDLIVKCSKGKYKVNDKEKLKIFFNSAYVS